ncbi:MAG: hypothetical protein AAGE52_11925 [Myxococcota bacterium]
MIRFALVASLALLAANSALADVSLGAGGQITNFGGLGLVDVRGRWGNTQLIGEVGFGREREAFVSGFVVDDALRIDARAGILSRVWSQDRTSFSILALAGVRGFFSGEGNAPDTDSWAIQAELGALVHRDVHDRATLRVGILVPLVFQVDPEFSNDMNGTLLSGGLALHFGEVHVVANLDLGGIFGADGDAGKFLARGTLNLRWAPSNWRHF